MPPSAPRTKTPPDQPTQARDVTDPEPATAAKRAPLPPPPIVRSRKATLVSPIPALLAESMTAFREESDGTPLPTDPGGRHERTSRFEAGVQRALLADDESEYVVEVDDLPVKPTPAK